jgi:tRNA nucleotidyltransferase (CCA-adding enzyme)
VISIDNSKIPEYVTHVTSTLINNGYEAFLVGGCVRDLIMDRTPKDWDITTNAEPEQIINLFEKTVYKNEFGTVIVCIPKDNYQEGVTYETVTQETSLYHNIEVTTYRIEEAYSDYRHPDKVIFSKKIEDDLKRRDFTINAMAYMPIISKANSEMNSKGHTDEMPLASKHESEKYKGHLKDMFDGLKDIKDKMIRTVNNPDDRFQEDALRMIRAIRFSTELNFSLSAETIESINKNSHLIKNISMERIRDEFSKIIMSQNPIIGISLLNKLKLLQYIIPELEEGIGCEQKGSHIYDVWEHTLQALDHSAKKDWSLEIRLSALFHDIGKPRTRRLAPQGQGKDPKKQYTFYGHEVVGARITKQIMERLKYPRDISEKVLSFTRNHMFFSDTEKITLSAVRRIVAHVGKDNIWDLMKVRECDRVGMKKAEAPYRLRKYHAMIEEVLHDPISVGQLAIDGKIMMEELSLKPGPRMGWILNALLEEVLDDPGKNTKEHLLELVKSLDMLGDDDLKALGERGKEKKEKLEKEEVKEIHKKHGV